MNPSQKPRKGSKGQIITPFASIKAEASSDSASEAAPVISQTSYLFPCHLFFFSPHLVLPSVVFFLLLFSFFLLLFAPSPFSVLPLVPSSETHPSSIQTPSPSFHDQSRASLEEIGRCLFLCSFFSLVAFPQTLVFEKRKGKNVLMKSL